MTRWRVDVKPTGGREPVVRKAYETKEDALHDFRALCETEDEHFIYALPYEALIVSLECMVEQDWEIVLREVITK